MSSSIATSPLAPPSLDLDFNEDQRAIAGALSSFCTDHLGLHNLKQLQPAFDRASWRALAELGIFAPGTFLGEGGALEICAISEALGKHVFPGPIAATYLAAQVLEGDELASVVDGNILVSLSNTGDTLLPWGSEAAIFLQTDGWAIHRAASTGILKAEQTLGGEPWARGSLVIKIRNLAHAERGLLLNAISTSAFLTAAGMQLVTESSDYANVRKQFGKTLGEFQGVAHPLADALISLTAAQQLARAAACCFDAGQLAEAKAYAAAAAVSSRRAALKAAYVCHQVYAGIGITLEGPAFHITRRIRQLASQAPGDAAGKQQLLKQIGLGSKS
jgi:alkylation response protein AidB-like acyl-CoA dehydrogenase